MLVEACADDEGPICEDEPEGLVKGIKITGLSKVSVVFVWGGKTHIVYCFCYISRRIMLVVERK